MLPFIDIVVPTFNRANMLERVIASLVTQSYPSERYQVIVIDDGSTDETWTRLQEMATRYARLKVLHIAHAGPYAARNEGWRAGRGDIVAFTDDDCVPDPGWLAVIATAFSNHPEALGVQGKTVTVPELVTPLTHQIVVRGPNYLYQTCNIAYRREVLSAVGGFDAKVFSAGDSQLGAAVSSLGPIIFSSEMVIIHPPRPRAFLDREHWTRRLEGALRLYCRQPDFFRRTRGSHFLLVVALRWGLLVPIKNALVHSPWMLRVPSIYFKFLVRLFKERVILAGMLPGFWRKHRGWVKNVNPNDPPSPGGISQ